MNKIKYIAFKRPDGIEDMVIFSWLVPHIDMVRTLGVAESIVGAGFMKFEVDANWPDTIVKPYCYGESTSLKIKSRGEDDQAIAREIFGIGED